MEENHSEKAAVSSGNSMWRTHHPLRYSTFNHDIARLDESAGFEDTLEGYCIRRAIDNAVDGESLEIWLAICKHCRWSMCRYRDQSGSWQGYETQSKVGYILSLRQRACQFWRSGCFLETTVQESINSRLRTHEPHLWSSRSDQC